MDTERTHGGNTFQLNEYSASGTQITQPRLPSPCDAPAGLSVFAVILSRNSAHFSKTSRAGQRVCPHLVKPYSTFGGTC